MRLLLIEYISSPERHRLSFQIESLNHQKKEAENRFRANKATNESVATIYRCFMHKI